MNRLLVALIGAGLLAACGGSESAPATQNSTPDASASDDASSQGGGGITEASTAAEASHSNEAGLDLDGVALPDGPYAACAVCTLGMCQTELASCVAAPACQAGLFCSLQNCPQFLGIDGGSAALLVCLTTCFGDIQQAIAAGPGIACALDKCPVCAELVDGGARD
jgi:hypothetical protein